MKMEIETFMSNYDVSDFKDALEKLVSDNIIYENQYPFLTSYNMSRRIETEMIFECFKYLGFTQKLYCLGFQLNEFGTMYCYFFFHEKIDSIKDAKRKHLDYFLKSD